MLHHSAPLFRNIYSSSKMARAIVRAASLPFSCPQTISHAFRSSSRVALIRNTACLTIFSLSSSSLFGGRFHAPCRGDEKFPKPRGEVFAAHREYRKVRRRTAKKNGKELELSVSICIEEGLPDDPEILSIAELLRLNVPMAMKTAFDGLKDSEYKTRDTAIQDVSGFQNVELSVLLSNDDFIRKLNKEWRDEDHATDVLSMSQHSPELDLPILMMGDIVISVETAARQAEERGHTLLDEIRILLVHGLLHLMGFDHEISEEAETEMEKEEEHLLKTLGWKGKGLIQSAYDAEICEKSNIVDGRKKAVFDSINQNSATFSVIWTVHF